MNGFVPRLWRSFMSSIDGQRVWRDFYNRFDARTRADNFRLNVYLPFEEPGIDDISRMDELRSSVHSQTKHNRECPEVVIALLISSFYFELLGTPTYSSGKYTCNGVIRSRLSGSVCISVSERLLQPEWSFVMNTIILGRFEKADDLCPQCRRYSKKVRFTVRDLNETITIYMRSQDHDQKRKISGFPRTVAWFLSEQYLGWVFGTPYQDADEHHSCIACNTIAPEGKRGSRDFETADRSRKRRRR